MNTVKMAAMFRGRKADEGDTGMGYVRARPSSRSQTGSCVSFPLTLMKIHVLLNGWPPAACPSRVRLSFSSIPVRGFSPREGTVVVSEGGCAVFRRETWKGCLHPRNAEAFGTMELTLLLRSDDFTVGAGVQDQFDIMPIK